MGTLGKVRVGDKAPDFHCDAVEKGMVTEVSLSNYISEDLPKHKWLIILFIPAAFSFVCPTEVLAFQNCLDEFKERNTNIVFVSVDTKHSLWHWQNVPRQYGGLGQVDIALLSDPSHKMSKDYGVLIEKEGICLRGMFILDDKGIVQHITLNNVTVGRSVLEALRLLEAFQAVDKHGVLCPIDWKPSTEASETLKTISNTLIESYDERLANLQKEFGDTPVTDLDAVHKTRSRTLSGNSGTSPSISRHSTIDESNDKQLEEDDYGRLHPLTITISHTDDCPPNITTEPTRTSSAPASTTATPIATTPLEARPGPPKKSATCGTARHSEGRCTSSSTSSSLPPYKPKLALRRTNTYESRRGSHVVLEFADPTSSPHDTAPSTPSPSLSLRSCLNYHSSNAGRVAEGGLTPIHSPHSAHAATPTRLQMTFDAIKKMSGMTSPRAETVLVKKNSRRTGMDSVDGDIRELDGEGEEGAGAGYFDVVCDGFGESD